MKYQYTPGRVESGGLRKPSARFRFRSLPALPQPARIISGQTMTISHVKRKTRLLLCTFMFAALR